VRHPHIEGPNDRVTLGVGVIVNDAVLNVVSGRITIGEYSFCGLGVSLLTGTHQISERGEARQKVVPDSGRDITIGKGVWIASNATILGPCVVGDNAVIAAGAIVTSDVVEDGAIVAGVPARDLRG
jgi:acetyltransferase-like isoleucine patch superfamily enzyme